MNSNILNVCVSLVNEKVQFEARAESEGSIDRVERSPIKIDYVPPIGDGLGYTFLELLLMSFSSCVGTSVLSLLRKMNKKINYFSINAKGVRRETHPTSFESICLSININAENTSIDDLEKVLKISEDSICPVWAMIKNNVKVETIVNFKK